MKHLLKASLCVLLLCAFFVGPSELFSQPRGYDRPDGAETIPQRPMQPTQPGSSEQIISANGVELVDLLNDTFSRRLGVTFLYDANLLAGKKVNLTALKVSDDKLFSVLETILAYYNLALIQPSTKDQKIYKIVSSNLAQKNNTPLYIFSKPEDLPTGSKVITVLFYLKNIQAQIVLNAVRPLLHHMECGTEGGEDVVILIDCADNIRRLATIIQAMDVKGPDSEVWINKLKHAQAEALATKLEQLLSATMQMDPGRGAPRGRYRSYGGASSTRVIADPRTNSIMIAGHRDNIEMAKIVIAQLDVESEIEREMRFYTLENTSADEIAYTLGEILDANVAASFSGAGQGLDPDSEGEGIESRTRVEERKSSKLQRKPEGVSQSEIDAIPMIIPEASLNRLIVIAPPKTHEEISEALKKLDIRKAQVLVEIAIVEITADDSFNLTTELSTMDLGSSTFGIGQTQFGVTKFTDSNGNGVFDTRTPISGLTGLLAGIARHNQIPLLIYALSTKTNINVVSTPLLLVNDNEEAVFESIREEPTTELTNGETTDTISFKEYVEAGIKVKVVPAISEGGKYLRLYIEQDVDSFVGTSTTAGVPPPKQRNHLTTTVTVPNDKTVIIGGMAVRDKTHTKSGVPFLSKIPIIGWLFRSEDKTDTQTRLYLFIKPQILDDADFGDLEKITRQKQKDVEKLTKKEEEGEEESDDEESGDNDEKRQGTGKDIEPAVTPHDDKDAVKPEETE